LTVTITNAVAVPNLNH